MDIEEERKAYEEKKLKKQLKDVIAPTREMRKKRIDAFKSFAYYLVIGVILLIVTIIVPFLSGGINANDFGYYLPKTVQGWVVFWAIRLGTVVGNLAVYGLFKLQAKTNVKDDPSYKRANELLYQMNGEEGFIPLSPKQKTVKDWTTKGVFMFVTTAAESIVIGTLIVNFDVVTFISCMTSSITAVLFGVVQMIRDEVYWTEDYLLYAEYTIKKREEEKAKESTKIPPEAIETAPESDVSVVVEELSEEEIKEAENA